MIDGFGDPGHDRKPEKGKQNKVGEGNISGGEIEYVLLRPYVNYQSTPNRFISMTKKTANIFLVSLRLYFNHVYRDGKK